MPNFFSYLIILKFNGVRVTFPSSLNRLEEWIKFNFFFVLKFHQRIPKFLKGRTYSFF